MVSLEAKINGYVYYFPPFVEYVCLLFMFRVFLAVHFRMLYESQNS